MTKKTRKRRSYLIVLPYIAVIGVLWLANLLLPHIDNSLDIPFTRDIMEEGVSYRQINRGYLSPFFPAGSPLIPELKSTYIRHPKPPNSFRVLCIGESSMFGVPFQMAATIPALVRKQLRHLYPELEIEVVNLGASAINSNVILEMVPEFLSLEPDLVLVYTGHNEFYGPDGIGASWIDRQVPGFTRWKYRMRRFPLVQLLQRGIAGVSGSKVEGDVNLMREVSAGAEVPLSSPEAERIFTQFEQNLREIVQGFRTRRIPMILGDISSSLMFPPFAPRPGIQADMIPSAIASGRFADAESLIAKGLAGDSANAYYLYWRGRLHLATGDTVNAVRFLERARDNDLLKFRAPGRMNGIIDQIGQAESVPVIPIDSVMRSHSRNGITDTTLFCEHLHPTFRGYDLIARQFVQAICDRGLVHPPRQPVGPLLPFDADSLSVPWVDLGFGALSLRALTSRWPFTDMPVRPSVLDNCDAWELKIVKDIYAGKVGWADACLQYAQNARQHQKHNAVVTALSALVEEYPRTYVFRYGLGAALDAIGGTSEAIEQYRLAVALKPDFPQVNVDLALLLIRSGQADEAGRRLESLLAGPGGAAVPGNVRAQALYGLAVIAADADSIRYSLELLEESLRLAPGYQAALTLRSQVQHMVH